LHCGLSCFLPCFGSPELYADTAQARQAHVLDQPAHPACSGLLQEVTWPAGIPGLRVDTWIHSGTEVTPFFDSLLAKVMIHAETREAAVGHMSRALTAMRVKGIPTNAQLMQCVLEDQTFLDGSYDTHLLLHMPLVPSYVEVRASESVSHLQPCLGARLLHLVHAAAPLPSPLMSTALI
jgi:Biotin carboxylase C-terminal domain